jgi:hypothetical protein
MEQRPPSLLACCNSKASDPDLTEDASRNPPNDPAPRCLQVAAPEPTKTSEDDAIVPSSRTCLRQSSERKLTLKRVWALPLCLPSLEKAFAGSRSRSESSGHPRISPQGPPRMHSGIVRPLHAVNVRARVCPDQSVRQPRARWRDETRSPSHRSIANRPTFDTLEHPQNYSGGKEHGSQEKVGSKERWGRREEGTDPGAGL